MTDEARGKETQKVDERVFSGLPPGTYQIDEDGNVRETVNWQPILERIPWENANDLINSWSQRGSREQLVNLIGMYILAGGVIAIVGFLAWGDILDGEATAGFLGAAIGYLLSRAQARSH